ncbi:MAG TPA: hypothetical protein PKW41_05745, partial [Clostridia bacterium]|nr:hypothetical protein [Clostridia bacterium]
VYMKKTYISLLLVSLLLCSSACSSKVSSDGAPSNAPASQLDYAYTSVEQLAGESALIILGTVEVETIADASCSFYTIKVEKILRGAERSDIKLYAFSGLLTQDARYMLFLQTRDSVFYTEPLILLTDSESLIEVSADENVSLPKQYDESYSSVEELCNMVRSLPAPETVAASTEAILDIVSDTELIGKSDNIFAGKITELTYNSAVGAGSAIISITVCYKGNLEGETATCLVPQGLLAGETYLFFRCDGIESMPSRSNSVFMIDSEEGRALIEQLKKLG